MNILITESQLKLIGEQMAIASRPISKPTGGKLSADDMVDYASAGLDVIPGIGNLASLGVDTVHAVSYMYRFFKTNNEQQKIEYGVMAFITLFMAFLPLGGNVANIATRKGLKNFLRRPPEEILGVLQKARVYNKKIWPLQKDRWTFSMGLFLYKSFKGELEEVAPSIYSKFNQLLKYTKNTPLYQPVNDFKNVFDNIQTNKDTYKKLIQYV